MDRFLIRGGHGLAGTVGVSGAKNAALPILAASLLSAEALELSNVPQLQDVRTMQRLLGEAAVVAWVPHSQAAILHSSTAAAHACIGLCQEQQGCLTACERFESHLATTGKAASTCVIVGVKPRQGCHMASMHILHVPLQASADETVYLGSLYAVP